MTQQRSARCIFIRKMNLRELQSSCTQAPIVIRLLVPRLHQFIALLLLVLWTPVASHCLLEVALGLEEIGCCESNGPAESGHSDCPTCLTVEGSQVKTESTILPAPRMLGATLEIFPLVLSGALKTRPVLPVIRQPADTPPVPPAAVILQATLAQPVRGPSLVA